MVIRAHAHRVLDFVTVAAFAVAPVALHLTSDAAIVAYALAAIHLLLTLATRFPGGRGPIPIGLHAITEFVVGILLVVVPWFVWTGVARTFYLIAGLVILAIWIGTSYAEREHKQPAK